MINYHALPLALTKDATITYTKIREVVKANKNTIRIEKDSDLQIHLRGLGGNSSFYFHVSNPKLGVSNASAITYTAEYTPKNTFSISVNRQSTVGESILKILIGWLEMLDNYNNLNVHPSDNITGQYEDEFEDWFEIAEDDAETHAFDAPRQILITNIINQSVKALKEAGFKDDEVMEDAEELKDSISKLTKKQAFDSIKRLYAKLKIKGGLKMVELVFKICRDEVIVMSYHWIVKNGGDKLLELIINP